MLDDRLAYYKIITCVNWEGADTWDLITVTRVSISGASVDPYYCGNSTNMLVWFCRDMKNASISYDTSIITNMSVTFSGFPSYTPIKLSWYDPSTSGGVSGNYIPSASTTFSNGSITITAPSFNRDIVAILKPE